MTELAVCANDRRLASFVWQTMGARGLACAHQDIITALSELAPEQVRQVYASSLALVKGGDEESDFDLLRALRVVSAMSLRHVLSDQGIEYRTEVMLRHCVEGLEREEFLLACRHAQSIETGLMRPALARLRNSVGVLGVLGVDAPSSCIEDTGEELADEISPPGEYLLTETEPPALPSESGAEPHGPTELGAASVAAPRAAASQTVLRRQSKVFGQSAALTWEIAALADHDSRAHPLCTVMIEAAAGDGAGRYHWDDKVVFMLTLRELPQVLGVLMGWSSSLEFKFHGKLKKKSLLIEHQDHGLHVRLSDARQRLSVPVLDADRYPLSILVLSALCANEPSLDSQAVLSVCRAMTQVARRND